jgi:AcrR family transcriptional regulator
MTRLSRRTLFAMAYPSKLTPESILGAALPLLEQDGQGALNMRTLAARLGVQASSLYRHYPDRAALLAAIEDNTTLALHTIMLQAAERATAPEARLKTAALAYLGYATAHPHLYALLLAPRPPAPAKPGPGKNLWNLVLQQVGEVSGDPDDTARTVALWAYLHGSALLTLSGQLGLSGDQGGFQLGLETLVEGFAAARKGAGTSAPAPTPS